MADSNLQRYLRLVRYATPYKRLATMQFVLMGGSVGLGLLKPWPLKVLIDNVAVGAPLAAWPALSPELLLLLACAVYLLLHAGDSLVQLASTASATLLSARMIRDLRADLLGRLQQLSLRFHDSHRVGDLVHRIAFNTSAVETAFQSGFMGVVKSALTLVCIFFVMLWLNALLTLVALAVAPFLVLCIRWYAKRIQRVSLAHQEQEGSVSSRAQETLSAIRLVKAFDRERDEHAAFERLAARSVGTRLRMTVLQNGFGLVTALILAMGTALLFYVGMGEVRRGALTIGEFLVFNAYLAMLYAPLSVLSYTASSVQSALGGGARLFEILEGKPEVTDAPNATPLERVQGAVTLRGLTFGYDPDRPVLHALDLEARPGETVAVVGETGGGKSTLLTLLMRFYDPWEGSIELDGRDIRTCTLTSFREQIALVPQEPLLLSSSIRENIAYGRPNATNEEIERAACMAEADEFIRELPEGYDTLVGERGGRLSVGQRQRISLARAFVRDAPILLLDEPTSALDAETEARLMERIAVFAQHRTVILVAHRLSTVRHADRIVVMGHGRILEAGAHAPLLAQQGAYARLWAAQTAGAEEG